MTLRAKSEEMIGRSLRSLLWQSRLAGVAVGGFLAFFAAMIGGVRTSLLPYAVVSGIALGLLLATLNWKRSTRRLGRSFLKLDGDYLEAQGVVNGGLSHFRFRLSDIAALELGHKKEALAGVSPAIQAIHSATLVVRERSGAWIDLQFAGVVFDADELSRFCAHALAQRTK